MITVLRRNLNIEKITYSNENKDEITNITYKKPLMKYNFIIETDSDIILNCTLFNNNKEIIKEIVINKDKYKESIIEIVAVSNLEKFDIYYFSMFDIADANFKRYATTNSQNYFRIATIVLESNNIIIALHNNHNKIEGVIDIEMDPEKIMNACLCDHNEFYKNKYESYIKRYSMLQEVDIYKSVAYLEAQVDLLTRVILNFVDETELTNTLKKADKYSVLNIKPLIDVEKEFTKSKSDFRRKQEEYYNLLHGE